jgi:hypothetical protein
MKKLIELLSIYFYRLSRRKSLNDYSINQLIKQPISRLVFRMFWIPEIVEGTLYWLHPTWVIQVSVVSYIYENRTAIEYPFWKTKVRFEKN